MQNMPFTLIIPHSHLIHELCVN